MTLITPTDREFSVMPAGYIRDKIILAHFRSGLRNLINPETGVLFTEDEIINATRPGSRWYREAHAIDSYGQGRQRNALWLIDQIRIDRASSKWVEDYHAAEQGLEPLDPTGGSGTVRITGTDGTIVNGSTTIGAAGVYTARDPLGNVYQVFIGGEIGSVTSGYVDLTMKAVSTGSTTNPTVGTTLRWITKASGMDLTCTVVTDNFRGGTDLETTSELIKRTRDAKRFKPAIGNDPQMRAWGRRASNAIEDCFIYPCALHAGSTITVITAKRAGAVGPLARIPNDGIMADAVSYLVPPLSPVVPPRTFVLPLPPNSEPSNLVYRLKLQRGTDAGWTDAIPFPAYHATTPKVTTVTSPTVFRITCPGDATLPNQEALATVTGEDVPSLMVWDTSTSSFFDLATTTTSVEDLGGNVFEVTLSIEPSVTIALDMIVSPTVKRSAIIASATEAYFDEIGPGDFFDIETDTRGGRCVRFPDVSDDFPARAGATVATRVIDALGGASADGTLDSISKTAPTYPTDILSGPNMLTLGTVGVYEI